MDKALARRGDNVGEIELPVIGNLLRQEAESQEVAVWLEALAGHVRARNIIGFKVSWDAGTEEINSALNLASPCRHMKLEFNLEESDKPYGR